MITWIVPTVDGREEGLARSIAPLETRDDIELIVIRNAPTCGKAWVDGARQATGDYIYFAADDIVPHDGFIEAMVETIDRNMHPAAIVLLPNGSQQSCGGVGGDVCRGSCADWAVTEWSPTPFIAAAWWEFIEPHADMLAALHYSSDRLVSACLAAHKIPSVVRRPAVITHYNDTPGRLNTASTDGWEFEQYRTMQALP